jgi:hypothetical protein
MSPNLRLTAERPSEQTLRMLTVRAALAAFIALWIAFLPAVAAMATASQSAIVTMSDDTGMPCDKPMDNDKAFFACALKCFQLCANNFFSPLTFPTRYCEKERSFATKFSARDLPYRLFRPPA